MTHRIHQAIHDGAPQRERSARYRRSMPLYFDNYLIFKICQLYGLGVANGWVSAVVPASQHDDRPDE
ncbi:hypothetical protein [Halomonas sp. THAF12]|uniref:hypothetical protein n=1 Tax=Halomonas sp. THAF12 TaxID=2587849 RepID=UPI001268C81C|nr:hypothetical protein [Halomonas sp. THAF12]